MAGGRSGRGVEEPALLRHHDRHPTGTQVGDRCDYMHVIDLVAILIYIDHTSYYVLARVNQLNHRKKEICVLLFFSCYSVQCESGLQLIRYIYMYIVLKISLLDAYICI